MSDNFPYNESRTVRIVGYPKTTDEISKILNESLEATKFKLSNVSEYKQNSTNFELMISIKWRSLKTNTLKEEIESKKEIINE